MSPLIQFAAAMFLLAAQQTVPANITFQDLVDGFKNPSRWLMYSGDYSGRRHSPLTQITPENARRLSATTVSPLVVKDKVVIGNSGGDM